MVSIVTNHSAMSALQTLRDINRSMGDTQGQVSSGLRVATASDNAAYWSIATTMRSDKGAVSAVKDALELGAAKVDVAYTGLSSTIGVLDEIKSKLVAATEAGLDRSKIQEEIAQLQSQLQAIAGSASFNGVNWLKANGADDLSALPASVVTSFTRANDGTVKVQSMDVDLSKTVLFNGGAGGLLEAASPTAPPAGPGDYGGLLSELEDHDDGETADIEVVFSGPFAVSSGDSISFDIRYGSDPLTPLGPTFAVSIDRATVDQALGTGANGQIDAGEDLGFVLRQALQNAGVFPSYDIYPDHFTFMAGATFITNLAVTTGPGTPHVTTGIMDMDVTGADADLDHYIDQVEIMLQSVTDAAANLGATQQRIAMQTGFSQILMETVSKGIGRLVDADMNEASTRLRALQTQEQLGIQALSIANAGSETLLQLFR